MQRKAVWTAREMGCNVTQEFAGAGNVRLGTEQEELEPEAFG